MEVLDRLHAVAVAAGLDEKIDSVAQAMPLEHLGPWTPPPTTANETLRLTARYPYADAFISASTMDWGPTAVYFALWQFVVFLLPAIAFTLEVLLGFLALRGTSKSATIIQYLWATILLPKDWVFFDNYRLHPNIWRGILAAAELAVFRMLYSPQPEEPLILALRSSRSGRLPDLPARMELMPQGRLYRLFPISLRRGAGYEPIPCYAAMRDLLQKWATGELPKKPGVMVGGRETRTVLGNEWTLSAGPPGPLIAGLV